MAQSRLGQNAILVPIGTTAERPSSPEAGEIRFNTDLDTFEGYDGFSWGSIGRGTESQNISFDDSAVLFTAADVQAAIEKASEAENTSYDNTESGLAADNVQGVIDQVSQAANISYDQTVTGLTATDVQGALDEVYSPYNIVGTVSESGGVPTGAIIESDSDSRGEWTRWADGTQAVVCFSRTGSAASTRSSGVSTSLSATVASFSYPRNFTSTPSVSAHLLSGTGQSTANLCAVRPTSSTSSVDISIMSLDGTTGVDLSCKVFAFGRYF